MNRPSRDDRGAGLVEYALLLGLIAVVCVGALSMVGSRTSAKVSVLGATLARDDGGLGAATTTTALGATTTTAVPATTTTAPAVTTTTAPVATTTTAPAVTTTTAPHGPPPTKCNRQGLPVGCVP